MAISERRARGRGKLTRKEIKAPDEFLTLTGRLLTLASAHGRLIAALVAGVVASILLVWGLLVYLDRTEQEALATLSQIEAQLRRNEGAEEVAPTLVEQLQQIPGRFGAGEARGHAWLYLGHVAYRKGDYPAALVAYRQAQAHGKAGSVLGALASLGVGYTLEASGDFLEAQKIYQQVIDASQTGFLAEAYLGKARAAEGSQDLTGAITAYSTVMERFPQYGEALGISEKVRELKARQ